MDAMGLLAQARDQAGSLVEKALAIDDAIGSWEDNLEQKAADKLKSIITADDGSSDDDEGAAKPQTLEERLGREQRRTRRLRLSLDFESGKTREAEASRDEMLAALQSVKLEVESRDATIQKLDAKLAEYAELIPKWERKNEEERRAEDVRRKHMQKVECERIQSVADEMVAAVQRELDLERAAKASIEFNMQQSFEDRARASDAGAQMLEDEQERYRILVPTLEDKNAQLHSMVRGLRERETARIQAAMDAELTATTLRQQLKEAEAGRDRSHEMCAQMQKVAATQQALREREAIEHATVVRRHERRIEVLRRENLALRATDGSSISGTGDQQDDGIEADTDGQNWATMQAESVEWDSVELTLIQEVQAAKRLAVGLRIKLSERQSQLHTIAQEWSQAKVLLHSREALISKLESHISGLSAAGSRSSAAVSTVPVPRVAQRMQQPIGAAAATGTGANAVLEVVSEQRDRLRIRVQQLEEEQLKLEAATQVAEDAASQAAADKQALLTRLRYAENFSRGSPSNPRTASNNTFSPDEEPSIDPFAKFVEQESEAAEIRLSRLDRYTLGFMQGFCNPLGRRFVLFYAIVLHFLVYALLVYAVL